MRTRNPRFCSLLLAALASVVGCQSRDEAVRLACDAPNAVDPFLPPDARGQALADFIDQHITNTEVMALIGSEESTAVRARKLDVLATAANLPTCALADLWRTASRRKGGDNNVDDLPANLKPPAPVTRVIGNRSMTSVTSSMQSRTQQFNACYEAGLRRNRSLSGVAVLRIVVAEDGMVLDAEDDGSSVPDGDVMRCLIREARTIVFPKEAGGTSTVLFPIELRIQNKPEHKQ